MSRRRRDLVMPLSALSPESRARIDALASQPHPPPRYLTVSFGMAQIESRAFYEWYWRRGRQPGRHAHLPDRVRAFVLKRDGLVCGICTGAVEPHDVHIDHIKPVVLGGAATPSNLRVTHSRCNRLKSSKWECAE